MYLTYLKFSDRNQKHTYFLVWPKLQSFFFTGGSAETKETASPDSSPDKKKKNRCNTCKKKVGLTGINPMVSLTHNMKPCTQASR